MKFTIVPTAVLLLAIAMPKSASATTVFSQYKPIIADAALDLDQRSLIARLALANKKGLLEAHDIYSKGGHSHPQAILLLESAPDAKIPGGTAVEGHTETGAKVHAIIAHHVEAGDTSVTVRYLVDGMTAPCQVGGSPTPDISGCFAASGKLRVGNLGNFHYSYSPTLDNTNALTLQRLSVRAEKELYEDLDRAVWPIPSYETFTDYYGEFDAADKWIQAAFAGSRVVLGGKEFDFANLDVEGRTAAIRWGTVLLNVWVHVIASVEKASIMCSLGNSEAAGLIWDEAFSLYAGSKADDTGVGGYLLFNLAKVKCKEFGTCKEEGDMGPVNAGTIENFVLGKNRLLDGNCSAVKSSVERIRTLMFVPLVQGTLKAAYQLDLNDCTRQRTQGEAAAFLTSIIPIINSCSSGSANIMFNDLAPGAATGASFEVIKAAFERNYECLGIKCEDVGGLVDASGEEYLPRAQPCGVSLVKTNDEHKNSSPSASPNKNEATKQENAESTTNLALALGLSFGLITLLALAVLGGYSWGKHQKEFDTADTSGNTLSSDISSDSSAEDFVDDKHII